MAMLLENSQHVIVVAHGLKIEEQWRKALYPQCRRGQQSAFHAMGYLIAQHSARRTKRIAIWLFVVCDLGIEEALDSLRCLERL